MFYNKNMQNEIYLKNIKYVNKFIILLVKIFLFSLLFLVGGYFGLFNYVTDLFIDNEVLKNNIVKYIEIIGYILFFIGLIGTLFLLNIKSNIKKKTDYKGPDEIDIKLKKIIENFFKRH